MPNGATSFPFWWTEMCCPPESLDSHHKGTLHCFSNLVRTSTKDNDADVSKLKLSVVYSCAILAPLSGCFQLGRIRTPCVGGGFLKDSKIHPHTNFYFSKGNYRRFCTFYSWCVFCVSEKSRILHLSGYFLQGLEKVKTSFVLFSAVFTNLWEMMMTKLSKTMFLLSFVMFFLSDICSNFSYCSCVMDYFLGGHDSCREGTAWKSLWVLTHVHVDWISHAKSNMNPICE